MNVKPPVVVASPDVVKQRIHSEYCIYITICISIRKFTHISNILVQTTTNKNKQYKIKARVDFL